jgi:hypothetical protein
MRGIFLAGFLCFGSLASAASLSVDFTQNPTAFNIDLHWDSFTFATASFSGTFLSNNATTGTDTVAIVDENTGELLDTFDMTFDSHGHDGTQSEETFGGTLVTGIDSGTAPAGDIPVDATGAPIDITGLIPDLPANITLFVTENSPSATPEPASLTLIGLGLTGVSLLRYRARKRH